MATSAMLPAHDIGRYGELERRPIDTRMSRVFLRVGNPEPVAIKELAAEAPDTMRDRFVREPKVLRALGHPQVPRVIEDHTEEDRPYFVMSRDPRFNSLTKPYSLDPVFVAQIVHSALSPIDRLHRLGLANRDIKPDHLLVDGMTRTAQLVDFGMAEKLGTARDKRAGVPGTHLYLSPEDLNGAPSSVTGDIYSLGVSMFELLAGRTAHTRPIRPEIAPARKAPPHILDRLAVEDSLVDDILRAQEEAETDTKLDLKVRQEWVEEEVDPAVLEEEFIPAGLIAVVETATARNPADRYPLATAMQEELEYFLQGQAVAA